ncbi:MAG: hypothetical protein PVJ08_09830 [Dehalococcoidia bacterium]|jgi:translation initiation factor IF-1
MRIIMDRRKLLGLMLSLALIVILISGCGPGTETRTGKLIGVQVSFSLDDAMEGEIEQMDFWGVVTIELDDGSQVDAAVDDELAQVLKGGDMVVIESVEGSEMWKVVELAD